MLTQCRLIYTILVTRENAGIVEEKDINAISTKVRLMVYRFVVI